MEWEACLMACEARYTCSFAWSALRCWRLYSWRPDSSSIGEFRRVLFLFRHSRPFCTNPETGGCSEAPRSRACCFAIRVRTAAVQPASRECAGSRIRSGAPWSPAFPLRMS